MSDSVATGAPVPARDSLRPRFLVDVNVGRLAKWLRILGYDASFIPDAEDGHLVKVAQAEGRILLTRDVRLMDRRPVTRGLLKALLIASDHLDEQLRQVVTAYGLDQDGKLSLCIECSEPLRSRPKEAVAGLVPPYVSQTQDAFFDCPNCGRVYWKGTHWSNMRQTLASTLGNQPSEERDRS